MLGFAVAHPNFSSLAAGVLPRFIFIFVYRKWSLAPTWSPEGGTVGMSVSLILLHSVSSDRIQRGFLVIRQGRRWDHHHKRAGHRHALPGPEPHGGGAAGHDQRGGR